MRVVNGARSTIRVGGPPNRTFGKTVGSFDSPSNTNIARTAFSCRSRPNIVADLASQSIGVFEDIEADAVRVFEPGSWVLGETSVNTFRIPKPISHGIQVMNRHDSTGEPALSFLPRHPVRDRSHVIVARTGLPMTDCFSEGA